MKQTTDTFIGTNGGRIFTPAWLPDTPARAIVLIVHGLGEHSGRYTNVVEHLLPLGYALYGIDHYGHGRSEGQRKYVPAFADFVTDVYTYHQKIKVANPSLPIYLMGHSMGGLIGTSYLLAHQQELAGAILSGPAVKMPIGTSPVTVVLARLLSRWVPRLGVAGLDANGVSRDPAVVQAYLHDPLVYLGKMTARLAAEMLATMQAVTTQMGQITLPILLLQGGADYIVDPSGAQLLYDNVSSVDKKVIYYDGLYHEVYNEPEKARVLADVATWLDARIATRG